MMISTPSIRSCKALLPALAALLLASLAWAQSAVTYKAADYAFEGPDTLHTGTVEITFENQGHESHHMQLGRLNDGVTMEQFQSAMQQGPDAALPLLEFVGGPGTLAPGRSETVLVELKKPGTYIALCFVPNAQGVPHAALGMVKPIQVTQAAATAAPQADLTVHMKDFAFDIPDRVSAGPQVWQIVNDGPQPHELGLMKVKDGKTMADVMAFLQSAQPQGEPPVEEVGGVNGLSPDHEGYAVLDLEPGQYLAVCFIPDPATGKPHVALGMLDSFTVEATATGN